LAAKTHEIGRELLEYEKLNCITDFFGCTKEKAQKILQNANMPSVDSLKNILQYNEAVAKLQFSTAAGFCRKKMLENLDAKKTLAE
jgi:hypothetical protein